MEAGVVDDEQLPWNQRTNACEKHPLFTPECGSGYTGGMVDTAKPRHRWYHLTPDRLLIGLLAVEGLLFLSERFQWFAFNQHKGWTVLIAVAAVCVGILFLLMWFLASLLFHRRFQFGIRSLFVLVVCVAVPCSWLAVEMWQARKQKEAVEAIVKVRGRVLYGYQVDASYNIVREAEPPGLPWLRNLLGQDFFSDVAHVYLDNPRVTDDDLQHLERLTEVQTLSIDFSRVTDAGLEHLSGLPRLQGLGLTKTGVTDAGLRHLMVLTRLRNLNLNATRITDSGVKETLKGMSELRRLDLTSTSVTDAGMEDLGELTQLQLLYLAYTQITDTGLEHLRGLSQLESLDLRKTRITGAGLEHLAGLSQLQYLNLSDTQVTDAGLRNLNALSRLRWLEITNAPVTDAGLEYVEKLDRLQQLHMSLTKATDAGVKKLQQALPHCSIDH